MIRPAQHQIVRTLVRLITASIVDSEDALHNGIMSHIADRLALHTYMVILHAARSRVGVRWCWLDNSTLGRLTGIRHACSLPADDSGHTRAQRLTSKTSPVCSGKY
jgi:hypothetical protein